MSTATAVKWWEGDLVVFDLETTDRYPETARIVTSCVGVLASDGHVRDAWEVLLNPGVPIHPAATELHGISDEMAADGHLPEVVLPLIVAALVRPLRTGTPVVAYNGRFDFTLLDRECRRYGLPTVEDELGAPVAPILDPYVMDKAADQYRKGSRTLTDTCAHYGVPLTAAHSAMADAVAAGHLAQRLGRTYKGLQLPLEKLHRAQEIWARQQAAGLERYLRRKENDDTIVCEREWPLVPMKETTRAATAQGSGSSASMTSD